MKFFTSFILCPIMAYAMGLFLPWWSVAIAGLLVGGFIPQKVGFTFLSTFLGTTLVYGTLIGLVSYNNDHILANRISQLVTKQLGPSVIILISALIPGLLAGISAMTGRLFTLLIRK